MTSRNLTPEQIGAFIRALKSGMVWTNGLVGSITYTYRDGQFIKTVQDRREPDAPIETTYTENSFWTHLEKRSFPDFVYRSLAEKLIQY